LDVISTSTEPLTNEALAQGARALLSASAVRNTARRMLDLAVAGSLDDWTVRLDRMPAVADFAANVVRQRYPQLNPPLHARWRHFVFDGRDLWQETKDARHWDTPAEAARAAFDLAITSVLLDAGAGPLWTYSDRARTWSDPDRAWSHPGDTATGLTLGRSEGLALASLRWFQAGGLSAQVGDPLRADAAALRRIDAQAIQHAFQSGPDNPLLGADGRAALLNRLGAALEARPDLFALADSPRPGGLFDVLVRRTSGQLPAPAILELVLEAFGPIWADRPQLAGVSLGDCWPHPALAGAGAAGPATQPEHFVPLHKLSQWLSYSLIEPLEAAGVLVSDIGGLTGLAEYRNGGLFVDLGVLVARDVAGASERTWRVADPFVVGWRALTVALLDELAPMVTARLGLSTEQFPLAKVLEGGTWAAGRLIAREKRADGGPPFKILSDGTVF
jgi:hypothetical protein